MAIDSKRILVTDDERNIVDIIAGMLARSGYTTLKAYSGEECLSIARAERPDLIFLDIMMERMDGWEVARIIKNDPAIKDIPIIMVTAKPLTFEDVRDRSVLIENYIMKPVSAATLKQALEEVFTARTRIERTLEMARKSGVAAEIINAYRDRYEKLHTQAQRNKKLLTLMSQLYPEDKLKASPASRNMLMSLKKGLESQEEELRRLEKILTTPAQ
ncbi:response regulator [Methanocella arvoryzae]|uniref:Response regulator n=1 Tax=Methanocella arvoryzae (strain DSM 22066 / NBRC 105507 / MRE50) TaxID=351160 RepID=Q0W3H8_METAR|nr:response regulator [Methanocella arvoryzae]CAJ37065.1 putative response regulator [Methanocella arvoryzae MRE50]